MDGTQSIYLVDDDPDDRFFIRQAFEHTKIQVEVIEVASGIEFLTLIQQKDKPPASLILMDMNMPRMSGVDTVRVMRSVQSIESIPVIMISTTTNPAFIKSAYEVGVAGFVSKPATIQGFNEMANDLSSRYLR